MTLSSYTCNLQKRPFVNVGDAMRATAYPIPIALIDRLLVDGATSSASSLRLFHALLFISWNTIDTIGIYRPLAYDATSIRRALGRRVSNAQLHAGLRTLTETRFALPNLDDPGELVESPLLDWQHIECGRRIFWSFSEPVRTWCSRFGTTYAWLDLRVTLSLSSVAALRLYEIGAVLALRKHRRLRVRHDELRGYLEVAAGTYLSSSDFKGKLLGRAIRNVNELAAFTLDCEPHSTIAHRFVEAAVLSVAPRRDNRAAAATGLQPIRRDDLAFVPLPAPEVYKDFCSRPSAPRLPTIDLASFNAVTADGERRSPSRSPRE
jgi:hypothetical protein